MSALKKSVALLQIREFYYNLDKMNKGYYKSTIDKEVFHVRSSHIAQHHGVPDDGDKTFFDNVQLEHFLSEFVTKKQLDGTVVNKGTILTNLMRA